ncbi:MAG: glycosyltransferase family 4 protein [Proteobacteria bacterium]|nr:glycosyltransferase family 4 protein [Pseudomonadota bacterium]
MPRVLLTGFCAVPGPRRAGVQLRHVIRALTPMHNVDLLVVREGDQGYVERQGSVRVLRVPSHEADLKSQIQSFQRALRRQLDGADYDVVHCRDSWSCIPVLEARARLGYAVVYDLTRSPLGETTGDAELDAQYARDEEACLIAADMILAPTMTAVKALATRGEPARVMLSPPGVDVDRFDWEDLPRPEDGPPKILYAGSIDPGRGIRVLVRAMAAIVREVDARLVIAGSMAPKFDQVLRDGVRELGLADKVEILGPIDHDQMPALIATASVCVVPAAADLSPNPTVVYPTKLLEYMACRRAIVAPKRETISQVVDNNHEALLFDPIDLARKVLRVLGEPLLRDRLAQHAYERVRRELTASAARRALRKAYDVLGERFATQFGEAEDDDAPKVEMLADDDFEATVFEEAPAPPAKRTGKAMTEMHEVTGAEVISGGGMVMSSDTSVSSEIVIDHDDDDHDDSPSGLFVAPPPPHNASEPDETMERTPVAADRHENMSGAWTIAIPPPPSKPQAITVAGMPHKDDWIVTSVAVGLVAAVPELPDEDVHEAHDDGTPIEGGTPAPAANVGEGTFVAGEIDVPTPPPERVENLPNVEFAASGAMLEQAENDPDTGSRTPPLERR